MRHGKTVNHLGRTSAHRKAMMANMACSLIEHKRINTTLAKARELRKYIEPLITKSKKDETHSRRMVFSYLGNKEAVKELFGEVAAKVGERPGGYTRIIKLGNRLGDAAEMCMIELVDFNTLYTANGKAEAAAKKPRTRRAGKKKAESAEESPASATAQAQPEAVAAEEPQKEEAKAAEPKAAKKPAAKKPAAKKEEKEDKEEK